MDASIDRRRQLREMVGWTILSTVMTLSRLVVWMDHRLDRDADGEDTPQ